MPSIIYLSKSKSWKFSSSIACVFSSLLKAEEHQVGLFDNSNYDLDADEYITFSNSNKALNEVNNLLVRPYESNSDSFIKHTSASNALINKMELFKPDLVAVTSTESTFNLAVQLLRANRKKISFKFISKPIFIVELMKK